MSLHVCLTRKRWISYDQGKTSTEEEEKLYSANITHNLGQMAEKAGIYEALWRPYRLKKEYDVPDNNYEIEYAFEDANPVKANEIIEILQKGLDDLKKRPKYFEKFNSPNRWGMYEHFVPFVEKYLEACIKYPESIVNTSR